jgi:hypothetical protein
VFQVAIRISFDAAIFFTFAIAIASCVTLGRASFGMGADGMGATTMKIAWIISTLTLLPLLPLVLRPEMFFTEPKATAQPPIEDEPHTSTHYNSERNVASARQGHRFMLFVLCWAASFYPFFSRMAGTFGILSDPPCLYFILINTQVQAKSATLRTLQFRKSISRRYRTHALAM